MKFFILLTFAVIGFAADFERNDTSQTVIDKKRNILWEDNIATATQKISYKNAFTYCHELNTNNGISWRLPHTAELLSIVDIGRTPTIITTFKHAATGGYWCDEQKKSTSTLQWIDFSDGSVYSGSGVDRYLFVRCVKNR